MPDRAKDITDEDRLWAKRLRRAIDRSGLSARQFAMQVLVRDERTIRRWLVRDAPIPEQVRQFLSAYLAEHRTAHTGGSDERSGGR
jgi:hypothetical protein